MKEKPSDWFLAFPDWCFSHPIHSAHNLSFQRENLMSLQWFPTVLLTKSKGPCCSRPHSDPTSPCPTAPHSSSQWSIPVSWPGHIYSDLWDFVRAVPCLELSSLHLCLVHFYSLFTSTYPSLIWCPVLPRHSTHRSNVTGYLLFWLLLQTLNSVSTLITNTAAGPAQTREQRAFHKYLLSTCMSILLTEGKAPPSKLKINCGKSIIHYK